MLYVVDDAQDYRFLVQQVFKRFLSQYTLALFPDGQALVDHLLQLSPDQGEPDLIVLDLDMPRLSGVETLSWLEKHPRWQNVPVVVMSNRSAPEFAPAVYERGGSGYLDKPMDIQGLQCTFTKLCQQWIDNKTT